jgi:hypothetical protein
VIVMAYVLMLITFSRGFIRLSRGLLFGSDQNRGCQRRIRLSSLKKDSGLPRTDDALWDW